MLPVEEVEERVIAEETVTTKSFGRVYARRQRTLTEDVAPDLVQPAPPSQDAELVQPAPSCLAAEFISHVSKPLQATLPTPAITRRRRQVETMSEPPRGSRRIAQLPPDGSNNHYAASVCRQLGLDDNLTEGNMDKYQKFWRKPLIRSHVKPMATMLGKEVPVNTDSLMSGTILW